ncbi:MAG: hypothetical protein L0H24_00630 [Microlunatus sp.]|nr:hypothetical protein [Microlunatus sp.]
MRCRVELGNPADPASVAYRISRTIIEDVVYSAVTAQLTEIGIDLNGPPGYLVWLDQRHYQFLARCADADSPAVGPVGRQPRNYLITATITDSSAVPQRAEAELFHHDADPEINAP